ncbi:ACT domain-containing protein [Phascolarctobacterium succinatutens]|jgi:ACT domain-containing protein|uniref:ACT domain-containing protein n=1 Tax=Phascolarctobacterium succinatutens TaxID=626940 RepID=UPI002612785B|nr:ACT domain-containing protein [uncultured Phascolarctobacterium sp.]
MRVVLTIVGKDKVGITAKVSNALAEMNINIININQNIMQGFFNMVLIADMAEANVPIADARDKMAALGEEIGVEIRLQSEEIFSAMHRI